MTKELVLPGQGVLDLDRVETDVTVTYRIVLPYLPPSKNAIAEAKGEEKQVHRRTARSTAMVSTVRSFFFAGIPRRGSTTIVTLRFGAHDILP